MASAENDTPATPALLLGGADNLVAAARCLVADGIEVVTIAEPSAPGHRVRGVTARPLPGEVTEVALVEWFEANGAEWEGAVLIALSDPAMHFVVHHHDALRARFAPATLDPDVMDAVLDKQRTVELAEQHGIAAPRLWQVDDRADIDLVLDEVVYPVIVKPRHTYELVRRRGRKYLSASNATQLRAQAEELFDLPGGFMVSEFIPGPDSLLTSYNAVVADDGTTIVEFTKRVERRFPVNEGPGTLHQMVHLPATVEVGRRFFEALEVRGVANVEFKLDTRDGQLKVIECNHRMTAALPLIHAAGIPLASIVYRQALGDVEPIEVTPDERWYWYPWGDLKAVRSTAGFNPLDWVKVLPRRAVKPYWSMSDLGPTIANSRNKIGGMVARKIGR